MVGESRYFCCCCSRHGGLLWEWAHTAICKAIEICTTNSKSSEPCLVPLARAIGSTRRMIPARGPQTVFLCNLCYAIFALQSLLCNFGCASFAMQSSLCFATQSLLCNCCYAIVAMQSLLCNLCYGPVKGHWPKCHVAMHA